MSHNMPSAAGAARSIRLDEAQINVLLDQLDEKAPVGHDKRMDERYSYRVSSCIVSLTQTGTGNAMAYSVPTRNLSAGGVAVLHGNFVHTGTPCNVQLMSAHGAWEIVEGAIAGCRHISGLIHEVRICFKRRIDVGMYCPDALRSRVLLADDDPLIVRLVERHLFDINVELTHVDDGQKAVDTALGQMFDLLLLDMDMPVLDGFGAAKQLRERGYSGRIVAATGFTGPAEVEKCIAAGCDSHMSKPFTRQGLVDLVRSLQQEPLFSSLSGDASMIDLINSFVEALPARLRAVEEAYCKRDVGALESHARRLKGEAGGYGFQPITDAAAALEDAVKKDPEMKGIKAEMDTVVSYCQLARAATSKSE